MARRGISMRVAQHTLEVATPGQGLHEITEAVARWVSGQGMRNGLLTLFLRHTSASLLIQENAAPEVRSDLEDFFRALAPEDYPALSPHGGGARRHAGSHPRRPPADAAVDPGRSGAPRLGDVAGHLRFRAPARAAPACGGADPDRRVDARRTATSAVLSLEVPRATALPLSRGGRTRPRRGRVPGPDRGGCGQRSCRSPAARRCAARGSR